MTELSLDDRYVARIVALEDRIKLLEAVASAAALGYMSHNSRTDTYSVSGVSIRKLSAALRAYADQHNVGLSAREEEKL